jgi:hypothetical protein
MNQDNVYKYLGLGVVTILAIYIGVKSLSFQVKMIEGMTNNTQTTSNNDFILIENMASTSAENVKKNNDKLSDIIAVNKYRSDYENLLISLEEYSNIMMFSAILETGKAISENGIGKKIPSTAYNSMVTANTFKSFIDSLNSSMKYVDRKK